MGQGAREHRLRQNQHEGSEPRAAKTEALGIRVKIFEEQISSRKADRPDLRAALEYLREGDVLVVWKLKAASAGLFKDLVKKVEFLKEKGVGFVTVSRNLWTRKPRAGALLFDVMGTTAEFEKDLMQCTGQGRASRRRGPRDARAAGR